MTPKSKPSREVANVVTNLLKIAVKGLGGASRPGQVQMAEAVANAFESGEHLAVQAGTGTGKSLAYLVPSIARALQTEQPVVVSTATIALQRQLVDRDLPRLVNSLADALPRKPTFALLKGRGNYLCLNKIHNGSAEEPADRPQDELFSPMAVSAMGRDVQRLTEWSSDTETGDRDEVIPGVPDRSWSQVSVSARACIGVSRCQFGTDCFAERAREKAGAADVIVTNHALLAIDALSDFSVLPEYEQLVVDEAHELADRVTGVATAELSATSMAVAHRRMSRLVDDELAERFEAAVATLSSMLHELDAGRIDVLDEELGTYLTALRDNGDKAEIVWERKDLALRGTPAQTAGDIGYTVAAIGAGLSLITFDTGTGNTVDSDPLPAATGTTTGTSIGPEGEVVVATRLGEIFAFTPDA